MLNNNNANNSANEVNNDIVLQPPLYFAQQHVWNICFHPQADIIACSEINGQIQVLSYTSDDVKPLIQSKELHKSSARYCTFNPSGNLLASCSQDKRLGFLDGNGKVAHIIKKAHPNPINRCKFLNDNVLMSGDDDGVIKVWDLRTVVPIFEADNQGQAITGFAFDLTLSQHQIYASSLNGTIAGYDLRQGTDSSNKVICISDSIDQQLNGIQMIKNGNYIVCPSSEGSIIIFKRQNLEHHINRIYGLPGSVDAIMKIDENTVAAGSQDGFVRGVGFMPNKILQSLGQHEQQQNFPIQSLSLSHCRRFAASSSHDNSIKFYDVNDFIINRSKTADITQQQQMNSGMQEQESALNWDKQAKQQNSEDFESDSEDSDQEEMQDKKKKKKKNKQSIKAREQQLKKNNIKSFFKGL